MKNKIKQPESDVIGAPLVNHFLLKRSFECFKKFVERQDGKPFTSFAYGYVDKEEGYKGQVYERAKEILAAETWTKSQIGTGTIIKAVIRAVEGHKLNNLLIHYARWSPEKREHYSLFKASEVPELCKDYESILYRFYKEDESSDESAFHDLVRMIKPTGFHFPFLAYLFFIKNRRRYLPLKPNIFNKIFEKLESPVRMSGSEKWVAYRQFLAVVEEVRSFLKQEMSEDVSLLDAHSFLWLLQSIPEKDSSEKGSDEARKIPVSPLELTELPDRLDKEDSSGDIPGRRGNFGVSPERMETIGKLAEACVLFEESRWLLEAGKPELVERVKDVSKENLGYDILSAELDGREKFIEVKGTTSKYPGNRKFYLTKNELKQSRKLKPFYLYLVYDVEGNPEIKRLENPQFENPKLFRMIPTQYEITYQPKI